MDSLFVPERWDSDPKEHRRKLASGVNQNGEILLEHDTTLGDHEDRITTLEGLPTGIQGTYDQVADNILQGNGAGGVLPAASTLVAGEYYELDAGTGLFTTPLTELNGRTGATGDRVIASSTGWVHVTGTGQYLSSVVDDSADGIITFNKPAKGSNPASVAEDYERQQEVDSKDAAHAALTAAANDVHGSAAYTNAQLTNHKGELADPDDVHGTKTYTDGAISAHEATENPHLPYVTSGHAGLYLSAPAAGATSITPTPTLVSGYDQEKQPAIDVVASLANGTLSFSEEGMWVVAFKFVFRCVDSSANTFRELQVDLYDETNGLYVLTLDYSGLARYQGVCSLGASVMFPVPVAAKFTEFGLRVSSSSGDTIPIDTVSLMEFDAYRVSNSGIIPIPRQGGGA